MKKLLLSFMLTCITTLGALAQIASGTCGDNGDNVKWELTTSEDFASEYTMTISGNGKIPDFESEYSVPWRTYRGKIRHLIIESGVTHIGDYSFYYSANLKNVELPNTLTSIGKSAFYNCSSLSSISIPSSLLEIGEQCFNGTDITSIYITDLAAWCKISFDGSNANPAFESNLYLNDSKVTSLNIPEGVTSISGYAFKGFESIISVTLPTSLSTIGECAFSTSSITSVTSKATTPPTIVSGTFSSFYTGVVTNVYVPYSSINTYKSADGWKDFSNISQMEVIAGNCGDNVTYALSKDGILTIAGSGDMYNYNLDFEDDDTYPTTPWRSYLSSVKEIVIEEGISSIHVGAFYKCSLAENVTIPSSVTWIGGYAFYGCSSLTSITCKATNPPTCYSEAFYEVPSTAAVYVPASSVEAYKAADTWKGFTNIQAIPVPHTLTYVVDGETYKTVEINEGETITPEAEPTKDGYVFSGWSEIPSTMGTEDITITGSFLAITAQGTCGDNVNWVLTDDGTLTISGSGEMNDYQDNSPAPWFSKREELKKVIIEDNITCIGERAFANCFNITDVTIPNSVENIGEGAFANCSSLKSISIPKGISNIEAVTFLNCKTLQNIIIPDGVKGIGSEAFCGCCSLVVVIMPSSITSIGNEAFANCTVLSSITCKASTPPTCDTNVFYHVSQTIPLYVPASSVEAYKAADTWKTFTNIQAIHYTLTYVVDGETYKTVELEEGDAITPEAEPTKDGYIFSGWSEIPATMGTEDITVTGSFLAITAQGTCGDHLTWVLTNDGTLTISGTGEMTDYTSSNSLPWYKYVSSICKLIINDGVTSIGERAFYDCTILISIAIPNSVTSIGNSAFYDCTGLTSIEIPNSVTSIGEYAFYDCTGLPVIDNIRYADTYAIGATDKTLSSYTLKEGTKFIGSYAFYNCTGLTSIIISNSVTSIGYNAFSGCTGLKSIVIPNSVTSIGYEAFYGCTGLTSIEIPNSVTYIGRSAFYNCKSLTSIEIPNSVTSSIGDKAFSGCSNLTSITIGNSVTSIGTSAFNGCYRLKSVTIPNSVTSIGYEAFYGCSSLTSVTIPNSVTRIYGGAFYDCSGITSITCESVTPPTCGGYAFYEVSTDIPVYVPKASLEAYKSADVWKNFTNIQSIKEVYNILDTETSFAQSTEYQYDELTYTRKFGSTNYQCLYIPMTVNVADLPTGLEVYKISAIYMFDNDGDGEYDETTLRIARIKSDILKANHPYFIKASVSGEYTIPSYDNILYKSEINTLDCATTELKSTFYGNYEKNVIGQEFYTLSSGIVKNMLSTVSLGAFRWYMLVSDRDGQTIKLPDSAAKIRIVVDGGDSATGIDETIANESAQKVVEGYYTLDGHKNDAPTSGVNIIKYTDGTSKKVFINK